MLVPAELRFAKKNLADVLTRLGAGFRPFSTWSEVADAILAFTERKEP